jgi:Tfp pilus assembly protein PilW
MTFAHLRQANGFTLMELLVASTLTIVVLGASVALTSQIQNGYRKQIEDSAGEQEARYALEWIGRSLRTVGNNPFNLTDADASPCPPGTGFTPLAITATSITLQSDSNPPDKNIGGATCTQTGEHVIISYDAAQRAITFNDLAVGTGATVRTDAVIGGLQFRYYNSAGIAAANEITDMTQAANVFYVQTIITIRSRTVNPSTGLPNTRTVTSETRVRGR